MVETDGISRKAFVVLNYFLLTLITLSCLFPIIHTIAVSFSSKTAAMAGLVTVFPVEFSVSAYRAILEDKQYFVSFFVSVRRVLLGGSINLLLTILMAYPLSKSTRYFPKRNLYMWYMVFTMLFGGGLIPFYLLVSRLNLIDTMWVLVLPGAVPIYNVIILMNYYRGLPNELDEAARIDGANPWVVLFRIFVPLSIPCLATVTLFSIVGHWNSFFDGIIYINSPERLPLQSYLKQFIVDTSMQGTLNMSPEQLQRVKDLSSKNFNAAKLFVSMVPVLAIYPFLQKYFVSGLVLGSVKG